MVLTIEEGLINKEISHVLDGQKSPAQAYLIMLLFNKAYQLCLFTIVLLTFLTSHIFYIISSKRPKLYLGIYLLIFIVFILGDLYMHKELIQEISNTLNKL